MSPGAGESGMFGWRMWHPVYTIGRHLTRAIHTIHVTCAALPSGVSLQVVRPDVCGFLLEKRRISAKSEGSSGRFVRFFASAFGVHYPQNLLVLVGLRCRRPCVVGNRSIGSMGSERFRRAVEQTGRFGRLGFRRS